MKNLDRTDTRLSLGAVPRPDGSTFFCVWAPYAETVSVETGRRHDVLRTDLARCKEGYFAGFGKGFGHNDLYRYVLDGRNAFADPASRSQPHGVHGPSRIVDHALFRWSDDGWKGIPLSHYIIYELHVGTFTREGTFAAAARCIEYVKDLGVNAIEFMPVCQFPGERNWGYDGVFPFAVHNSYGGPEGFKALVDTCHRCGICVVLDVVYNHLGPEGNCLGRYGPYFTDRYRTPWGSAINFDGPHSDEVRRFFIQSALAWVTDYHVDALRIDAVHGIFDFSARTFLEDLAAAVKERGRDLGKTFYLIAESDLNDIRIVTSQKKGGIGFDAQWNDDFHHALHTLLTGELDGYYRDFDTLGHLAAAFRGGYVYTGQFSRYRRKKHGTSSMDVPAAGFVVFSQNHDQVGNRAMGERLASLVTAAKLRTAAVAVLFSPYVPLLFMGEEYGEVAPFLYFVSHSDKGLIEAVRTGRAEEFSAFAWKVAIPDPQAEETFLQSKIERELSFTEPSSVLRSFYTHLIKLRHSLRFWEMRKRRPTVRIISRNKVLRVLMPLVTGDIACFFNFSEDETSIRSALPAGSWAKIVDSEAFRWGGNGERAPRNVRRPVPCGDEKPFRIGPFNTVVYKRES